MKNNLDLYLGTAFRAYSLDCGENYGRSRSCTIAIGRRQFDRTVPQAQGGGGGGLLPYKGLMGTCGQPGYVFRDFCLKQGIDFIIFCLNQVLILSIFVLNRVSFLGR